MNSSCNISSSRGKSPDLQNSIDKDNDFLKDLEEEKTTDLSSSIDKNKKILFVKTDDLDTDK
jgi:hypothetical protein